VTRTGLSVAVLAAVLAAVSSAACGSGQSAGPLQTASSGGQPVVAMASVVIVPGQSADGEAYVTNSAHSPVHVIGVSAVAVRGEPAGQLIHAGVQSTGAGIAATAGWPVVPARPLIGAELPHGLTGILFGITGLVAGRDYAVAGLRLTYTYNDRSYAVIAWAGLAACVAATRRSATPSCQTFQNKVNGIIMKMAGTSS
jgi:hypothetical protein